MGISKQIPVSRFPFDVLADFFAVPLVEMQEDVPRDDDGAAAGSHLSGAGTVMTRSEHETE